MNLASDLLLSAEIDYRSARIRREWDGIRRRRERRRHSAEAPSPVAGRPRAGDDLG